MRKLTIGLTLALVAVAGYMTAMARRQNPRPFVPLTVTYRVTDYDDRGNATPVGTETRVRSASGAWHETKEMADGTRREIFSEPGRGVFGVQDGRMIRLSDAATAPDERTHEQRRAEHDYTRDDNIAGYPVAVFKTTSPDGKASSEFYSAPSLGGMVLKMVIREPGLTRVREAISVERGEPAAALLAHPELPVKDWKLQDKR
ncbi:MAG: hypothetical protein LC785_05405 [Acidobacteria bacterium]|nr:hypothetical protein [Acidobacteriota bacterium]MCA1641389.1 hypothetical protein [Acidobacteriota bacterium]